MANRWILKWYSRGMVLLHIINIVNCKHAANAHIRHIDGLYGFIWNLMLEIQFSVAFNLHHKCHGEMWMLEKSNGVSVGWIVCREHDIHFSTTLIINWINCWATFCCCCCCCCVGVSIFTSHQSKNNRSIILGRKLYIFFVLFCCCPDDIINENNWTVLKVHCT